MRGDVNLKESNGHLQRNLNGRWGQIGNPGKVHTRRIGLCRQQQNTEVILKFNKL